MVNAAADLKRGEAQAAVNTNQASLNFRLSVAWPGLQQATEYWIPMGKQSLWWAVCAGNMGCGHRGLAS